MKDEISRRDFLKTVAFAGAAVSVAHAGFARAEGELGFWAKDLSNEKLVGIYTNICRIRWHERTMADKMLTDPKYRGYNHFYAGQEAVALADATCAPATAFFLALPFDLTKEAVLVAVSEKVFRTQKAHKCSICSPAYRKKQGEGRQNGTLLPAAGDRNRQS